MLRILIVTHAFPPMNSIGSHRPYGWARAWRDAGNEIHVLTPAKYGFDGAMDLQLDTTGIEVHEVDYLPLHRSSADSAGIGQGVKRWERMKTLTRRARFSMAMFADLRFLAYPPMLRKGLAMLRSQRFDMIVATSPPEVSFLIARGLSARTGIPWIADFRDLWFRDMRLYQSRVASWLAGRVNRWMVKSASGLVTVSDGLRKRLSGYLGREALISYNGYFESQRCAPEAVSSVDQRIHMVYTGRLYPGKYDPEPLFRALTRLREARDERVHRICVEFYGHEEPWLRSMIGRYGLESIVHIRGFVPYRESLAAQRAADVILFLDWTEAEGVLTGKLFEYLGSGRPILSLGRRKDSEAAKLIEETGAGVTLTSDEEIVSFLKSLVKEPVASTGSPANQRFSREEQARVLLAELGASLPHSRSERDRHSYPA
ncbi:MAG TPA: glycosyltransferase [Dehalococcoidia bacterium]|nr:glycosyltransferase [Dehalococcoidia bacterium]